MAWIPAITVLALALVSAFNPVITQAISDNPTLAAILAGLMAVLTALTKSPVAK